MFRKFVLFLAAISLSCSLISTSFAADSSLVNAPEVRAAARYINYSFKSGRVGTSYSDYVTYGGGYSPYTVSYSGTLPTGLKLTYQKYGSRATLSGTPTRSGTYSFRITVKDSLGYSVSKSFSVYIASSYTSSLSINYSFTGGRVGTSYSDYVTYSGGTTPYTVSYSGTLPYGLKLTYQKYGSRATLSGTPTRSGTYSFRITVKDYLGYSVSKSFSVYIASSSYSSSLYINYSFTSGRVGTSYSDFVSYGGGYSPYTVSYSGTLPYGLKLTYQKYGSRATLSGTPTVSGSYSFRITVKDSLGRSVSKSLSVYIYSSYSSSAASAGGSGISEKSEAHIAVPDSKTLSSSSEESGELEAEKVTYINSEGANYTYKIALSVLDDNNNQVNQADKDERDQDLITVQAGEPVTFIIGKCLRSDGQEAAISNSRVFVDFNYDENITVSDEGTFTIPAELVHGDFVVSVKAEANNNEAEADELYIEAID